MVSITIHYNIINSMSYMSKETTLKVKFDRLWSLDENIISYHEARVSQVS